MRYERPKFVHCPHCRALYHVICGEAGPETDDRKIVCGACNGPLLGREGQYELKYFHLKDSGGSRPKPDR
jgi:hypothetical protein